MVTYKEILTYKIIYKQGILNGDADAISRWLRELSENNVEEQ